MCHPIAPVGAASDTTSSQFIVLVPGLQEPSAANLLSELITAHIEFLCFIWSKCLIRCDIYNNKIARLKYLELKIPTFLNCDNYRKHRSTNPNPTSDDVKLNNNALHQQMCTHFIVDYLEEIDIIKQSKK